MNHKKWADIFLYLLLLAYILIFIFPYGEEPDTYQAGQDMNWLPFYILEDWSLSIFYLIFGLSLTIYLFIQIKWVKQVMKYLLLGISLLYFILSSAALIVPVQDFYPDLSILAAWFIFPLLIIYLVLTHSQKKCEHITNSRNSSTG